MSAPLVVLLRSLLRTVRRWVSPVERKRTQRTDSESCEDLRDPAGVPGPVSIVLGKTAVKHRMRR